MTTTLPVTIGWQVWEAAPEQSDYAPRGGTVIDEGVDDAGRYVIVAEFRRNRGKPEARRLKFYLSDLAPQANEPFGATLSKIRASLCEVLSTRFDPDLWQGLVNIVEVINERP